MNNQKQITKWTPTLHALLDRIKKAETPNGHAEVLHHDLRTLRNLNPKHYDQRIEEIIKDAHKRLDLLENLANNLKAYE